MSSDPSTTPGLGPRFRSLVGRGVGTAVWETKTVVAKYPAVAMPLARLRGHGEMLAEDTDILIESFVRSGLSFAVAAFRLAQEPHPIRVAHHTHAPAPLIEAVKRGVPALLVVREPKGAILSSLVKNPKVTARSAIRGWIRFHEPLVPYRRGFVIGTFPQVTEDFGSVIRRVNKRFDTDFGEFEHTEANVQRVIRLIDEDWRTKVRSAHELEVAASRPSELREQLKAAFREEYLAAPHALRKSAQRLYETLAREASP